MRWARASQHISVFEHSSSDSTTILWLRCCHCFWSNNYVIQFHLTWDCDEMAIFHHWNALMGTAMVLFVQMLPFLFLVFISPLLPFSRLLDDEYTIHFTLKHFQEIVTIQRALSSINVIVATTQVFVFTMFLSTILLLLYLFYLTLFPKKKLFNLLRVEFTIYLVFSLHDL